MQIAQVVHDKKRECGFRRKGGVYLMTGTDASPDGALPFFVRISPPIPNTMAQTRGPIIVDGTQILARTPCDEWLAGSSKERLQNKQGDAWAEEVFGMTEHQRLTTGECTYLGTIDGALAYLLSKIVWDVRVVDYIRDLTKLEISKVERAAAPFARLVRGAQTYADTNKLDGLIDIVAATWQLAASLPPKKRLDFVPVLMRILVVIGLPKDAMALRDKYSGD